MKLVINNVQEEYVKNLQDIINKGGVTVNYETSNLLDLQYSFLLKQKHSEIKQLTIATDNSFNNDKLEKDWGRISAYLALMAELEPKGSIELENFPYKGLQKIDKFALGKILPLMPINNETYFYFSQKVENAWQDLTEKDSDNIIRFKHWERDSKNKTPADNKIQDLFQRIVCNACMNYLFYDEGLPVNFNKSRKEYFLSASFFQKIRGISILSFLIFCAYDKTSKVDIVEIIRKERKKKNRKGAYTKDELTNALPNDKEVALDILNACDIADGILQLIENVVYHAGDNGSPGQGFLSFRIHSNIKGASDKVDDPENIDKNYLEHRFENYFDGYNNRPINGEKSELEMYKRYLSLPIEELKGNNANIIEKLKKLEETIELRRDMREKTRHYLEIRISDYSKKKLCQGFRESLKNRGINKKLRNRFAGIKLSDFFAPSDEMQNLWDDYFNDPENSIHHYGLQLFDSLLASNDGCMVALSGDDSYTTSGDLLTEDIKNAIPGTQYSILLPFKKKEERPRINLNANINYKMPVNHQVNVMQDESAINKFMNYLNKEHTINSQQDKEDHIENLSEFLKSVNLGSNNIIVFDAKNISYENAEFFCKAVLLAIRCKTLIDNNLYANIAIINCEYLQFIEIVRNLAVFFNRLGESTLFHNLQFYLCGENTLEELLLAGGNLKYALTVQSKMSFARGYSTYIINILDQMLQKRPGLQSAIEKDFHFTPFDLFVKYDNLSIFEKNVLQVLQNDIQEIALGCKINPTHMRLGSKVHIDTFYSAELLFYNNYYTNRFAFLIKEIIDELIYNNDPILFVSYETYSEMLICELIQLYANCENKVDYCIFEYEKEDRFGYTEGERFRRLEILSSPEWSDFQVIFVVPINSTLSTFNKLESAFKDELRKEGLKVKEYKVVGYIDVIQIRDQVENKPGITEIEGKYWESINLKKRTIECKLLKDNKKNQTVNYLILQSAKWRDPLECELCFPTNSLFEQPLVETNKASVIPTQMFGLTVNEWKWNNNLEFKNTGGKIDDLKKCVYCGHFERNDNHYEYYIRTDLCFNNNKEKIIRWLNDLKVETKKQEAKKEASNFLQYDIIVCPSHASNAAFVEAVNETYFNGASLVLIIEVDKEFRDNFKAKHSSLTAIYQHLLDANKQANINFYFVDDEIIQGRNFNRTRSLIKSLFPLEAFHEANNVQVNLFHKVFVLINRLSSSSILDYVDNPSDYYCFIDVRIPSLRMHKNACVLCNELNYARNLVKHSATTALGNIWQTRQKKLAVKKALFEIDTDKDINNKEAFLYLYCNHILNVEYDKLSYKDNLKNEKNLKESVFSCLIVTIAKEINKSLDYDELIAFLEVASRPFISFRKASQEAIFDLIIILFDSILVCDNKRMKIDNIIQSLTRDQASLPADQKQFSVEKIEIFEKNKTQIESILKKIYLILREKNCAQQLLHVLMERSVALKSNYIIRKKNIINIFCFANDNGFLESKDFRNHYLAMVKRLISLSSDESKSTYLEHLLLFGDNYSHNHDALTSGNELLGNIPEELNKEVSNAIRSFSRWMYIENTKVLYDAIQDIVRGKDVSAEEEYFFENYRRVMGWNGCTVREDLKDISLKLSELFTEITKNGLAQDPNNKSQSIIKVEEKTRESYRELARKMGEVLGDNTFVAWVCERAEYEPYIDDETHDVIFYEKSVKRFDVFADNCDKLSPDNSVDSSKALAMLNNCLDKLELETYFISNLYCFIKFNNVINPKYDASYEEYKNDHFSDLGTDHIEEPIYLIVRFLNESEAPKTVDLLRGLRYILMFHNKILKRLEQDFNNNLMQQVLKEISTREQLSKARSRYHSDDNYFNNDDPKITIRNHFFGKCIDENQLKEDSGYGLKEAALGLYINTQIGRINTKLLSGNKTLYGRRLNSSPVRFNRRETFFQSVKNMPLIDRILICDRNGNISGDGCLLPKEIFDDIYIYRDNSSGKTPSFDYVEAFIYELINSAGKYGKPENDDRVKLCVYIDEPYLWFKNRVKENFNKDSIVLGIRREKQGISLATICEFFEVFYREEADNNHVKIILPDSDNDNSLSIGLPFLITTEKEK